MSHRILTTIAALLAGALLCSCSGEDEGALSSTAAKDVARRFHDAMAKGDASAAAQLARAPFWYKEPTRRWEDQASIEKNLAKEVRRVQHLLAGLDQVEAFSRTALAKGEWPRGKDVPKDRREADINALGVAAGGYLVRIFSGSKAGYTMVVNPSDGQLAVQGLDL